MTAMNKNLLLVIFLMISFFGVSQNVVHSYVSDFAKLHGELEKEFGKNTSIIDYDYLTKDSNPYSLQVIGTSSYKSFLKDTKIHDIVRILYINNVDFKLINNHVFDKLKKLRAVKINNCKNINSDELVYNLSFLKELEQLHLKRLKFKNNDDFNVNKLSNLKVLTFDNCRLKDFSKVFLSLDEFSIYNSKNKLNLNKLFITSVKKVTIKNCLIDSFPFNLSTSKDLELLDLTGSKIKSKVDHNITGFKNLLDLDITDAKINFENVSFLDRNIPFSLIRGAEVLDVLIIDEKY